MATKSARLLPCSVFFALGRPGAGCLALAMQFSIVLWPFAARWARSLQDRQGVDRLLAQISETYRVPAANIYARHRKGFGRPRRLRAAA